jgi:hypothetical protein
VIIFLEKFLADMKNDYASVIKVIIFLEKFLADMKNDYASFSTSDHHRCSCRVLYSTRLFSFNHDKFVII